MLFDDHFLVQRCDHVTKQCLDKKGNAVKTKTDVECRNIGIYRLVGLDEIHIIYRIECDEFESLEGRGGPPYFD